MKQNAQEEQEVTSSSSSSGFSAHRLFSPPSTLSVTTFPQTDSQSNIQTITLDQDYKSHLIMFCIELFLSGVLSLISYKLQGSPYRFEYAIHLEYHVSLISFSFLAGTYLLSLIFFNQKQCNSKNTRLILTVLSLVSPFVIFEIASISPTFINPVLIIVMVFQPRRVSIFQIQSNLTNQQPLYLITIQYCMVLYSIVRLFIEHYSSISYFTIGISFLLTIALCNNNRCTFIEKSKVNISNKKSIMRLNEDLIQVRSFYSQLLQHVPTGIAVVDSKKKVHYMNKGVETLLNLDQPHKDLQNLDFIEELNRIGWKKSRKGKPQSPIKESNLKVAKEVTKPDRIVSVNIINNNNNNSSCISSSKDILALQPQQQCNISSCVDMSICAQVPDINRSDFEQNNKQQDNSRPEKVFFQETQRSNESLSENKKNQNYLQSSFKEQLNLLFSQHEGYDATEELIQHQICERQEKGETMKLKVKLIKYDFPSAKQREENISCVGSEGKCSKKQKTDKQFDNNNKIEMKEKSSVSSRTSPHNRQTNKDNEQDDLEKQNQNSQGRINSNSVAIILIEDESSISKMKKLEDQNQYKMRMLACVSHELRTPLNCSISMLQIMREDLLAIEQKSMVKDNLDPALHSSKLLLNLINDILDFAQLEAGKFQITAQDFNLRSILRECLILISIQAKMKNVKLILVLGENDKEEFNNDSEIRVPLDPPSIAIESTPYQESYSKYFLNSDPNRVRQIVLNLLSNALKFTEKGSITLKTTIISKLPLAIQISCEDTGIGIPKERCKTIFDNFNKADLQNRIKYNQCGAGLGLSISNQLAKVLCPPEFANNPIVVSSEEGKGSSFTFVVRDQSDQQERQFMSQFRQESHLSLNDYEGPSSIIHAVPKSFHTSKRSQFSKMFISMSAEGEGTMILQKQAQSGIENDLTAAISAAAAPTGSFQRIELIPYTRDECLIQQSTGLMPSEADHYYFNKQGSFLPLSISKIKKVESVSETLTPQLKLNSEQVQQSPLISFMNNNNFVSQLNESYQIESPTVIAQLRPLNFDVARYEMHEKKKSENEPGFSTNRFNKRPSSSILSCQNISSILPIKKELLQSSAQTAFPDQNQNYVYSYSLNSKGSIIQQGQNIANQQSWQMQLSLQQQQQTQGGTAGISGGSQRKIENSIHSKSKAGTQKEISIVSYDSLNDFKLKQLVQKCNHAQILVVDDNQFNILAMKSQLNKFHIKIDMAFSGKSALEFIQKRLDRTDTCCNNHYLMIFMDIDMPVMNGYETTSLILEQFQAANISPHQCPIVACSAFVSPEDQQAALNSGMLDYIVKPVMLGTLDQVFSHWFVKRPKSTITFPELNN